RGKAIVRFYDDAWELCVERLGAVASLSVYRTGNEPHVAVLDRAVAFEEVVASARDAIASVLARGTAAREIAVEMRAVEETLALVDLAALGDCDEVDAPGPVVVEIDRDAPIAFGAEFALRAGAAADGEQRVERA